MGRVEVTINVTMSYSPEEIFERIVENLIPALITSVASISHVEAYDYKVVSESDLGRVIEVYDKISEVRIAKISIMMDRLKGRLRIDVYRGD